VRVFLSGLVERLCGEILRGSELVGSGVTFFVLSLALFTCMLLLAVEESLGVEDGGLASLISESGGCFLTLSNFLR
jgi:hypothetical protein